MKSCIGIFVCLYSPVCWLAIYYCMVDDVLDQFLVGTTAESSKVAQNWSSE
jgi:hypothetical protein